MNNFEPRYTKLASQYLCQKLEALTIKEQEPKPKSLLTKVMSNFKKNKNGNYSPHLKDRIPLNHTSQRFKFI